MLIQNLRVLEEVRQRKDADGVHTDYVTDFIFRDGIKPRSLYVIEHPPHRKEMLTMAEYIEREALKCENLEKYMTVMEVNTKEYGNQIVVAVDDLMYLPTADVAEVKRGEWKLHEDGSGTCNRCRITQKNVWDYDNWQNYCGHCGAKMSGGKQ